MTYEELEINTEIKLREKPDEEKRQYMAVPCTVVAKYPSMCIVEDKRGRRRGVAVGELVMNKVITQEPYFESMRRNVSNDNKQTGWRKRNMKMAAEGDAD